LACRKFKGEEEDFPGETNYRFLKSIKTPYFFLPETPVAQPKK
jgi:hypothetical protein